MRMVFASSPWLDAGPAGGPIMEGGPIIESLRKTGLELIMQELCL
jgi:hypothetical protein